MPLLAVRFWSKVDKKRDDECWLWLGTTNKKYGQIRAGRKRYAHQVSWEIHYGISWPIGLQSRHTCDQPLCVNPYHIIPGTQSENEKDKVDRKRNPHALKTHCVHGHEFSKENTYVYAIGHRQCKQCTLDRNRRYKHSAST